MTSGKQKTFRISLDTKFRADDFQFHHRELECDGKWEVFTRENLPINLSSLGNVMFPVVPFIGCSKCQSAYLIPGFQELAEKLVATQIVVSDRILSYREIKFLRTHFGFTQKEITEKIELESMSYYSKCETGKPGFSLSPDKQVRLKLFYATELGINRAEDYHTISLTSGSAEYKAPAPVISIDPGEIKKLVCAINEKYSSQSSCKQA